MRIYGDDHGALVFALQKELYELSRSSGVFAVARPIAYLPERKLLVMETVHGKELQDELRGDDGLVAITRTAVGLAALHNFVVSDLVEKSIDDHIEVATATKEMLKSILPDMAHEVDSIFRTLNERKGVSFKTGTVHGDFYCGQALFDDQSVTILDFDRSSKGDIIVDIGNFIAHLRLLHLQGELDNAPRFEQAFLSAYEGALGKRIPGQCLDFWTAFGLFQMSVGPFRSLTKDWVRKTHDILDECRRIFNL